MKSIRALLMLVVVFPFVGLGESHQKNEASAGLEWIDLNEDQTGFIRRLSGRPFQPWGFNYDHDRCGRLLEDYWDSEWSVVAEDFREMKELGANVVRVHLQLGKFMRSPEEPNSSALDQLSRLLELAERTGLYLDITGLGCYHKQDVPEWYDQLDEAGRWDVQARFWLAVAKTARNSPSVFCYDLMNEPVLPGAKKESEWLLGELGGKFFVQRIALDLAGRTRKEVAKAWVGKLAGAIRKEDDRHLITVGVIPWALVFPKAQPLFYSPEVGENLDFVSVHFYPRKGEIEKAVEALTVYDVSKPLVIEEIFPLRCTQEELETFIEQSRKIAEGWIGFYWGKTIEEYMDDEELPSVITRNWLQYFQRNAAH